MLTISAVTYRIGGRTLIEQASAQIAEGSKVGLVGRNGAGKSTLLDLIRGALQPDGGSIEVPRGYRIGFLAQEAPGGEAGALETVLAADQERAGLFAEREGGAEPLRAAEIEARLVEIDAHSAPSRAARILAGLGLDDGMQRRPVADLSGGWRMRVALAAILFAEPDLLLLDEPTNHLDLEAALWLERFLRNYRRTLILVSHDRRFLNAVTTVTLHLQHGKLTAYSGGFDAYLRARTEAAQRLESLARQQSFERQRMQAFVDRFRYKASKARQAQSRLKALARLEPIVLPAEETPARIAFPDPLQLNPPLIALEGAAVGYVSGKPVLSRLDLRLDPDDRIALLGANGNGKTTLARLLAGRLAPMAGRVTRSPKLACGFFAQHQIEEMRPDESAFDHLSALMPDRPAEVVRARLGRFGFGQEKAFVAVSDLSGGERARLNLALVTHHAPALLILDEPTNHLDIEAREALVQAINDFPGAVVLVSHDWHLLELVADRLWLVEDGTAQPFEGDLEDYERRVLDGDGSAKGSRSSELQSCSRRAARRLAAERRRELEPLRQAARRAEEKITRLTEEREILDRVLAQPPGPRDNGLALTAALKRRAEVVRLIERAEIEWLTAEESLEGETR
ncbi:MAG TPA: ABC-F family ATP-binding cassette domain-containing protein [Stellaceae bacterium]|jgi:ATP-binding cassette subfamily F protein 3|nr:ABC-F family ATP-binding cassette domain-containing protein [Stellaceae bacterium]